MGIHEQNEISTFIEVKVEDRETLHFSTKGQLSRSSQVRGFPVFHASKLTGGCLI
jgi:hypothetical protein